MLILFTDSDTDMTPEMCAEYGYNLISGIGSDSFF